MSCGTPTPATTRVVQIEPGPTPTLTPETPALISASAPSAVATLPPISGSSGKVPVDRLDRLEHAPGVSVGGVDHDHVDPRIDQRLGAFEAVDPAPTAAPQRRRPEVVLGGVREALALLDVLDRDQPAQHARLVDDEELLDPVLVEEFLGPLQRRARAGP